MEEIMVTKTNTDEALLGKIDNLQLSNRLFQLKDAMFGAPRIISVDRARLAVESWRRRREKILNSAGLNYSRKSLKMCP
jgi:hypothetical protein